MASFMCHDFPLLLLSYFLFGGGNLSSQSSGRINRRLFDSLGSQPALDFPLHFPTSFPVLNAGTFPAWHLYLVRLWCFLPFSGFCSFICLSFGDWLSRGPDKSQLIVLPISFSEFQLSLLLFAFGCFPTSSNIILIDSFSDCSHDHFTLLS